MSPIFFGGSMSLEVKRVIDAVGLRTALQMAPFRDLPDHADTWPFPLKQRRPAGSSRSAGRHIEPQSREAVADQLVEALDQWLGLVADQQLSRQGRRLVQMIVGEALDNAERHSVPGSDDGEWAIAGCLVKRKIGGEAIFRCHLALLSTGASIAESIATAPSSTLAQMASYVTSHKSGYLTEEALQTVFALQDGVTKDHNAFAEGRGGTGLLDIVDFFSDLGGSASLRHQARMAIVSGKTCLNLSRPYIGFAANTGSRSGRELWFNTSNDRSKPPDPAHVLALPYRLSGTLIAMVVDLDPTYLEATVDASN